ncbi:unnamed protein product [Protopolystoma xenopodis]|uniref:Caspase family p20 domain-containing protein n=1 Tax=Protopolystoma xenopodis TaxID=117903 RepID=A0A3S5B3I0_9PLAT|nr:unnamed protein product [Protopolystoma xenopodis]
MTKLTEDVDYDASETSENIPQQPSPPRLISETARRKASSMDPMEYYPMASPRRGICLLINNMTFWDDDDKLSVGSAENPHTQQGSSLFYDLYQRSFRRIAFTSRASEKGDRF